MALSNKSCWIVREERDAPDESAKYLSRVCQRCCSTRRTDSHFCGKRLLTQLKIERLLSVERTTDAQKLELVEARCKRIKQDIKQI